VEKGGTKCCYVDRSAHIELEADDGFRLQALGSLFHFKFNGLAFGEGLIALRLNGAVMHEDVLAALTLDEPIALAGVKPLYRSLFFTQLLTPLNGKLFALVVASRVQKKGRRGIYPGSLVDVSKSSHKSNKRSSIVTRIPWRPTSIL